MTLRELTEAWIKGRTVSGVDAEGLAYAGRPISLQLMPDRVTALLHAVPEGFICISYRLVQTSRFNKVFQEVEIDLEPVR
jgi:hypothetical protein